MRKFPIGLMSYVKFDDEHENGRLTEFGKRLSGEVQFQTGEYFRIFPDTFDMKWGSHFKDLIDEWMDADTFLIPIITPSFFKSNRCRDELERFLARESHLGRNDLILPLYYVNCSVLNEDPLARAISERNYVDWRELRFEPFHSPQSAKKMAKLAMQIVEAIGSRVREPGRKPCSLAALPFGHLGRGARAPAERDAAGRRFDAGPRAAPKSEIQKVVDAPFLDGDHAKVSNCIFPHQTVWLTQGRRGVFEEYELP